MKRYTFLAASLILPCILALNVQSAVFIGNVTPTPNDQTVRDNGYTGKIGSTIINTWGDTFQCDNAYYQTNCQLAGHHYVYTNAASTENSATSFQDQPDANRPNYFCGYPFGEDATTNALGVSNVVPTSSNAGVVYTFAYRRNTPNNNNTNIGAGLGAVTLSGSTPSCSRPAQYWWNASEPFYGIYSAWLDSAGGYIHVMGNSNYTKAGFDYVYMARVPVGRATTLSAYQYWNGTTWQADRILPNRQNALLDTSGQPLIGMSNPQIGLGQGQAMWSSYLKQYLYCDRWGYSKFRCRTASNPQGPWSPPTDIFDGTSIGGCSSLPHYCDDNACYTYAPSLHPYYDDTGKSIVFWFTCHPNIIQAVNVTFT